MSGDRLPNPTPPFAGTVGRLINESEAVPLQGLRSPAAAPNVVLILLDDVGFGTCTIGRDGDATAQMKAGVGPVIEDKAKVLVDPGSPFRDQQHPEGRYKDVRRTARDVAVREAVDPESAHVHVPLEFQCAGQGPVPEICRGRALRDRSPGACEQVPVFGRSAVESTGVVGLGMDQP